MADESTPILAFSPYEVVADERDADEQPPPMLTSEFDGRLLVKCKVCDSIISLDDKTDCHVIKCNICQEATPIKPAPFGKKYVRCRCKCLLICKASSKRVACPRENCKLVMVLDGSIENNRLLNQNIVRVVCAHCQQLFLFSISSKNLARCPHCKKTSCVGRQHNKTKIIIFFALGFIALLAGCLLLGLTLNLSRSHKGIIAAYVFVFIVMAFLLFRAFSLCRIKVSQIDDVQNNSQITQNHL